MKKYYFVVMVMAIILDQVSKSWAITQAKAGNALIYVTDFFNIASAWNYGVSFGMLNGTEGAPTLLLWMTGAMCLGLFFWFLRTKNSILSLSLSCIIGGAVGNLIDRIQYGAVYDFLDVHAFGIHFWTFNLADAFISIGAIIILAEMIWVELKRKNLKT